MSAYALTVGRARPRDVGEHRRERDVDPDVQAARHEVSEDVLGGAGFARYEVSELGAPRRGVAPQRPLLSAGEYAGFGAGAHGHRNGRRYWRTRLPRDYVELGCPGVSTEAGSEELPPDERAREP